MEDTLCICGSVVNSDSNSNFKQPEIFPRTSEIWLSKLINWFINLLSKCSKIILKFQPVYVEEIKLYY